MCIRDRASGRRTADREEDDDPAATGLDPEAAMIIDAATLDDLDAIMALEAEGFDHGHWSADAWRSELLLSLIHI